MSVEQALNSINFAGAYDGACASFEGAREWDLNSLESRPDSIDGLLRLLSVAVETGARFSRDALDLPPLSWLCRRLDLFEGRAAIDACRDPECFRRAMVLHDLALDLDTSAGALRGIPWQPGPQSGLSFSSDGAGYEDPDACPALYTCVIRVEVDEELVDIFSLFVAGSVEEVSRRLCSKYGAWLAGEATIRAGFDCRQMGDENILLEPIRNYLASIDLQPAGTSRGLLFTAELRSRPGIPSLQECC